MKISVSSKEQFNLVVFTEHSLFVKPAAGWANTPKMNVACHSELTMQIWGLNSIMGSVLWKLVAFCGTLKCTSGVLVFCENTNQSGRNKEISGRKKNISLVIDFIIHVMKQFLV